MTTTKAGDLTVLHGGVGDPGDTARAIDARRYCSTPAAIEAPAARCRPAATCPVRSRREREHQGCPSSRVGRPAVSTTFVACTVVNVGTDVRTIVIETRRSKPTTCMTLDSEVKAALRAKRTPASDDSTIEIERRATFDMTATEERSPVRYYLLINAPNYYKNLRT